MSGCWTRRISTVMHTITNANSVPMLTISSRASIGVNAATMQMTRPVSVVEMCGVLNCGWTTPKIEWRQQLVAGHGQEDARLAEEGDQQHARHAGQGAGGDEQARKAQHAAVLALRPACGRRRRWRP